MEPNAYQAPQEAGTARQLTEPPKGFSWRRVAILLGGVFGFFMLIGLIDLFSFWLMTRR